MDEGRLDQQDLEALNGALPELYRLRDVTELMPVMLEIAGCLIPTSLSTYNEFNIETGALVAAYRPAEMQAPMEALMPQMSAAIGENPLFRNYLLTGDGDPRFISDFLTAEEWRTNKFRLASASMGVGDTLTFSLTDTKPFWIFLALSRPQRDFTPRDRAMAGLLRTHFSAAYANALAYTQSQAKAMVFDQMIDSSLYGLILLDQSNQILHISPAANDLMRRYFPLQDGWQVQLPAPLQNWIKELDVSSSVTLSPLILVHDEKRLVIRASLLEKNRRTLLLRETAPTSGPDRLESLGLSKREAEVLYWIAEGKGNSEVAVILGVSKRTIEKHLESVYKKLHVENRMSAMVVANGILARS